jgi:uncharacterized protein YcbX
MASLLELWRHPVKSLQGEQVEAVDLTETGVAGDRTWAIRDATTGKVLTGRRTPELLHASARLGADGAPALTLPDGTTVGGPGPATDAALSEWLGTPVALVPAGARARGDTRVIEFYEDATDDTSAVLDFTLRAPTFVDLFPLLVITTASLRQGAEHHPEGDWVARRFRPNLVIDVEGTGWLEDRWKGCEVTIGDVVVLPKTACSRCSMVTREQPGLPPDTAIFKVLARHHRTNLGMWSNVVRPGTVRVGDPVVVAGT